MPRKRRRAKIRINPADELRAWRMVFKAGFDYLGDLGTREYRFIEWHHSPALLAVAADAWRRLGPEYMSKWPPEARRPWAWDRFGDPTCQ